MVQSHVIGLVAALTAALAGPAMACETASKDKVMTSSDQPPATSGGSVVPPAIVLPVEVGGIRIAPAETGLPLDARDTNGWFRATDTASGETVWLKQAFTAPPAEDGDPMAGADTVLFTRSLTVDGDTVVVEDDLGRRFSIDPKTGDSQALD